MNLRAEHKRAMENELQTGKFPLANQRCVLTAPSLIAVENKRFSVDDLRNSRQRVLWRWENCTRPFSPHLARLDPRGMG